MTTPVTPPAPIRSTHLWEVGRPHWVANLKEWCAFELVIIPDPLLLGEDAVQDDEPNAAQALLNLIYKAWAEGTASVVRAYRWEASEVSRTGGRVPTDEAADSVHATVAGALPPGVGATDICTIPQEGNNGVYTIRRISPDPWGFATHMILENFAHRSVG